MSRRAALCASPTEPHLRHSHRDQHPTARAGRCVSAWRYQPSVAPVACGVSASAVRGARSAQQLHERESEPPIRALQAPLALFFIAFTLRRRRHRHLAQGVTIALAPSPPTRVAPALRRVRPRGRSLVRPKCCEPGDDFGKQRIHHLQDGSQPFVTVCTQGFRFLLADIALRITPVWKKDVLSRPYRTPCRVRRRQVTRT